jgi:hypothetical protein
MVAERRSNSHEEKGSPWGSFAKAVFIVLLTVMFFLLAQSMAHHHFGGGGRDNYGGQH